MSRVLRPEGGFVRSEETTDLTKYVRVRSPEGARFVEFDFAIGDPSLFVELVLPPQAFEQFCQNNQVVHMTPEQIAAVDSEMEKWRYGEDTLMAKNLADKHAETESSK